jgi:hypothetical protein
MMNYISINAKSMCLSSRPFSYYIDVNRVKLISAIDSIYNEEEWKVRGVLPFRKEYLQKEMMIKDHYMFQAIEYSQYKKSEITSMYYNMLMMEESLGYLWLIEWDFNGVKMISIYKCSIPEDLLLLKAISKVLLSIIIVYEGLPNISRLNELQNKHYAFLNQQQNVDNLVKIDLTYSMYKIHKSRILKYLISFKNEGIIFNLLKQILFIPIYDRKTDKELQFYGIPLIGEITNVIMHHIYHIIFDIRLEEKYPGITYTRFGPEVFIVIKQSDSFKIKESDINNLLEELDIKDYNIETIYRDESNMLPACNGEKAIMLDEYGDLEVWKYEDI